MDFWHDDPSDVVKSSRKEPVRRQVEPSAKPEAKEHAERKEAAARSADTGTHAPRDAGAAREKKRASGQTEGGVSAETKSGKPKPGKLREMFNYSDRL